MPDLLFSCYYTAAPFPSNTTLMKRLMIRNSKKLKRPTNRRHLYNLTRKQLRAAMTIPVMYEQLKREKLRLHQARYVLASWGKRRTKELKEPSENQPFVILESYACHSAADSWFPVSFTPIPRLLHLHLPLACENYELKLLWLPLCYLRLFIGPDDSVTEYAASLVAC